MGKNNNFVNKKDWKFFNTNMKGGGDEKFKVGDHVKLKSYAFLNSGLPNNTQNEWSITFIGGYLEPSKIILTNLKDSKITHFTDKESVIPLSEVDNNTNIIPPFGGVGSSSDVGSDSDENNQQSSTERSYGLLPLRRNTYDRVKPSDESQSSIYDADVSIRGEGSRYSSRRGSYGQPDDMSIRGEEEFNSQPGSNYSNRPITFDSQSRSSSDSDFSLGLPSTGAFGVHNLGSNDRISTITEFGPASEFNKERIINPNLQQFGDDEFEELVRLSRSELEAKCSSDTRIRLLVCEQTPEMNHFWMRKTLYDHLKRLELTQVSGFDQFKPTDDWLMINFLKASKVQFTSIDELTRMTILNLSGLRPEPSLLEARVKKIARLPYRGLSLLQYNEATGEHDPVPWVNVTRIDLSHNELKDLPEGGLGDFPQLKILDLRNNNFQSLPMNLGNVPNLETVYLGGNPNKCITDAHLAGYPNVSFIFQASELVADFPEGYNKASMPTTEYINAIPEPAFLQNSDIQQNSAISQQKEGIVTRLTKFFTR